VEISQRVLGLPARVGQPKQFQGLINDSQTTSLATSIGLLSYAKQQGSGEAVSHKFSLPTAVKDLHLEKIGSTAVGLIKKLLP
jgi:cell division ATPase FtsA